MLPSVKEIILKQDRQRESLRQNQEGVKFGRPTAELPKDFLRTYELYQNGLIKVKDVMSMCNIAKSTFYK